MQVHKSQPDMQVHTKQLYMSVGRKTTVNDHFVSVDKLTRQWTYNQPVSLKLLYLYYVTVSPAVTGPRDTTHAQSAKTVTTVTFLVQSSTGAQTDLNQNTFLAIYDRPQPINSSRHCIEENSNHQFSHRHRTDWLQIIFPTPRNLSY